MSGAPDEPSALGYPIGEKFLNFLGVADQDPAFAGEVPRFVAEIRDIFHATEIEAYLDGVQRAGPPGHVGSDEVYKEMREAGAVDENPVRWAEAILLIERARTRERRANAAKSLVSRQGLEPWTPLIKRRGTVMSRPSVLSRTC